ncbi:MAG TPA: hypothetical protein VEG63_13790 [Candidatus Acidoferrales bacterium]|nr:hypothetical protein [Candidatus Acidoferrales bacterium]
MKIKAALRALVALAVLAALAAYLWAPGRTPLGQPPLVTLSAASVPEFAAAFDAAPAGPRLVLLVSPT